MSFRISGRVSLIGILLGLASGGLACTSEFDDCAGDRSCSPGDGGSDSGGAGGGAPVGSAGKGPGQPGGGGSDGETGADDGAGGETGEAGGGGGSSSETEDPNAVRGVVKHVSGFPLAGWTVVVDGVTAVTDEDGKFTVPGVDEEYDLLIAPTDHHLRLYQGLTTRKPVVAMTLRTGDPGNDFKSANISGAVSNALVGRLHVESWTDERDPGLYDFTYIPTSFTYTYSADEPFSTTVSWGSQKDPLPVELFLVNSDGTSWRTGSAQLNVSPGNDYTNLAVPLTEHATRMVTISAEHDDALAPNVLSGCVGGACAFQEDLTFPADISLPTGLPSKRKITVKAGGDTEAGLYGAWARVSDAQDAITLPMHAPPAILSPASDEPVDKETLFSWEPYPEGIHYLKITASTAFQLEVYTAETSFSLSMIDGIEYVPALQHTWSVIGTGPLSSVDTYVASQPLLVEVGDIVHLGASAARTFTP